MKTKLEMFNDGVLLASAFCMANNLAMPSVFALPAAEWEFKECAYYRPTYIKICIDKCAEIGTEGRAWSYPGYSVDRTPYGVIAHEIGHHVDVSHSKIKRGYYGDFSIDIHEQSKEKPLTSYAPNTGEWFAEMMRLYITNPDLLSKIRPRTHELLAKHFLPVVFDSYETILKETNGRQLWVAQLKAADVERSKFYRERAIRAQSI